MRLWVELPTVVSHGLMWATGAGAVAVGPWLPAEAATNTPAAAAPKKACSVASLKVPPPVLGPIEKLMTLTPSLTAWLMAATLLAVAQPFLPVTASVQHTL
jgi:hypothetical protein